MLILASFLRKNQRALKLSTLTLLNMLLNNFHTDFSTELLNKVNNYIIFIQNILFHIYICYT